MYARRAGSNVIAITGPRDDQLDLGGLLDWPYTANRLTFARAALVFY